MIVPRNEPHRTQFFADVAQAIAVDIVVRYGALGDGELVQQAVAVQIEGFCREVGRATAEAHAQYLQKAGSHGV